jgi:aldehyde dehydrogenase (NAD+)
MFSQKGEKCSECTRFLIHKNIYAEVVDKLITKANAVKCGDPFASDSTQGAQCGKGQFDNIMRYIEIGKKEAELVAGGIADIAGNNANGYFIRPTIFSNVDRKATIAQEEIFGPVLACTSFETDEEAVDIANDSVFGLAAGLYTSNVSRAHRVAEQLEAGMVFVNRYGCYGLASPFGGYKQSGWGKEMGRQSLASYTKEKAVWIAY